MSLQFPSYFTGGDFPSTPADTPRDVKLSSHDGNVLFQQDGVLFPESWSDQSATIVSSKYFYGAHDKGDDPTTGGRETSLRQLVYRVARTIADEGMDKGYFNDTDSEVFYDELTYILENQYGAFNSPVWFNVGLGHVYGIREEDYTSHIYGWNSDSGKVGRVDPYLRPQASACFIISIDDTIEDIWNCMSESARLFKYGSGVGADWSKLRSTRDSIRGGGQPSGPVSFMKVQDSTGGTIKSGGKTRRAAIMQTLKSWHPDIMEFVTAKINEEKKAHALIDMGYDGSFNGPAYGSVAFQNVNQSVRLDDAFMEAYKLGLKQPWNEADGYSDWYDLRSPATDQVLDQQPAGEIMDRIAEGTWFCGDPGVQYEDAIQKWHTCPNDGPINSSNPCSEYMFLDDSACNLASINLKKFYDTTSKTYDTEGLEHTSRVLITAMDILVDLAGYPSANIAENSHKYRPLGLGFANLGATLMAMGLPYDGETGRSFAGAVMSVIHAAAYEQSAQVAAEIGPFERYEANKESMLHVLDMHCSATYYATAEPYLSEVIGSIWARAMPLNDRMLESAKQYGVRNSQATVLAPTGTISFMMGCDTTGIEPELALVKYKKLAGAGDGVMKIVNQTVREGLEALGYGTLKVAEIITYIDEHGHVDGCTYLKPEHLDVFDTSFKPAGCSRVLGWQSHIRMMAACQPFISGAISKTVNMPETATVEEIAKAYTLGWELGLKAVAIYRENSKRSQPLNTSMDDSKETEGNAYAELLFHDVNDNEISTRVHPDDWRTLLKSFQDYDLHANDLQNKIEEFEEDYNDAESKLRVANNKAFRRRLPDDRASVTHKFEIAGNKGYLHVGLYPDTLQPGEIFVTMAKEGSTMAGLMDSFATMVSMGLQYGVPLTQLVDKFTHVSFEPAGMTGLALKGDEDLRTTTSVVDYIFRWMQQTFVTKTRATALHPLFNTGGDGLVEHGPPTVSVPTPVLETQIGGTTATQTTSSAPYAGPPCSVCGGITQPSGSCMVCTSCGSTTGCG